MTRTAPNSGRHVGARDVRWSWVVAAGLVLTGVVVTVFRPTAPPLPAPGPLDAALSAFPSTTLDLVEQWVGPVRTARLLSIVVHVVVPGLLVGTRRGRALVRTVGGERGTVWRAAAFVVVAVSVAGLPLRWWIGWQHAGDFGFRTSGPVRFVAEELGAIALEVVVTATAASILVWLVRRRPADWPAVGTVVGTGLTALLALVSPLVLTPLLLTPSPLDDDDVRAAVAPVVAASTLDDPLVEVGDASVRTTRVNAFVTGYGPARRLVLYDTLVALEPGRVAAVVGHELAHVEHRDIERAVLASAGGIAVALLVVGGGLVQLDRRGRRPGAAVTGAGVVAAVLVLELATLPVVAWQSRRAEAAADHRALELTMDPATAVTTWRGFVLEDLADPTPPAWVRLLGSHPTVTERIRASIAFAEQHGLDPVPDGLGRMTARTGGDLGGPPAEVPAVAGP